MESWNFAIQQVAAVELTLDVAYVGNHGVDTAVNYNLNAASVAGGGNASLPEYKFNNRTATTNYFWDGFSTSYNALQVKLNRRFPDRST